MINLGIDASTTKIGWSVVEHGPYGSKLLDFGYISLKSSEDLLDRVLYVADVLKPYIEKHRPDNIILEKYLGSFSLMNKDGQRTGPNANVVVMLAKWNGMLQLLLYNIHGKKPLLGHPTTIRRIGLGDTLRGCGNVKDEVLKRVTKLFPMFPVKFPKDRDGNIRKEIYDVADSIVCSLCSNTRELENDEKYIEAQKFEKEKEKYKKAKAKITASQQKQLQDALAEMLG